MKFIRIHPLTLLAFIIAIFMKKNMYFVLYFFVFLHELSHFALAFFLGCKSTALHLYPWGCMLSLSSVPDKKKRLIIFLAGPLFNFLMVMLNVFPKENLSLAFFNLIPVMPLDGGVVLNILLPEHYFLISFLFIMLIGVFSFYKGSFPTLSCLLLCILIIGEKNKLKKSIDLKVIHHFNQK